MSGIIVAIVVSVVPILLTVLAYFISIGNGIVQRVEDNLEDETSDEVVSSLGDKEMFVNTHQAKKIVGEAVKLVLERYRLGDSELRNAPQEAEYLAGEILRAVNKIDSENINEVSSGLFTLRALGTSNLLRSLKEEMSYVQIKWGGNPKISRMIELTESNMQNRLEEPMQIRFVDDSAQTITNDSVFEVQY